MTAPWMPPLPSTPWVLHMHAQKYEPAWTSTQNGYEDDDMRAYGQACARAALEQAALLCDEFQRQHGDSDNHGAFLALRIRAITKEITS